MGGTILLIDDNPYLMKLNRNALTSHGYSVLECATIAEGWVLLNDENPDLIMMEVELPDGNGLRFCEELRNYSNIPVMFVSNLDSKEDELAGIDAGGDYYLHKPYDMEMLVMRTDALLRYVRRAKGVVGIE